MSLNTFQQNISIDEDKEKDNYIIGTHFSPSAWSTVIGPFIGKKITKADILILKKLENKTKICKNVKRNGKSIWGVCTIKDCSFSHCMLEMNSSICYNGDMCTLRNGYLDKDNEPNPYLGTCIYRHPSESTFDYMKRLYNNHSMRPFDLPYVNDDTYKPTY
jgi:hypothetical protein